MSQYSLLSCIMADGVPVSPNAPLLRTINGFKIKYILQVNVKQDSGAAVRCFRIYYEETPNLPLNEYDIPAGTLTLADFLDNLDDNYNIQNLIFFSNLLMVDGAPLPAPAPGVIVNMQSYSTSYNSANNTSVVFVDLGSGKSFKTKAFVVAGNQTVVYE